MKTNQKTIDLSYLKKGLYVTFICESKQGEVAYNSLVTQNGSPTILTRDLNKVLYQLKKAGYGVRATKKSKLSVQDIFNDMDNSPWF